MTFLLVVSKLLYISKYSSVHLGYVIFSATIQDRLIRIQYSFYIVCQSVSGALVILDRMLICWSKFIQFPIPIAFLQIIIVPVDFYLILRFL